MTTPDVILVLEDDQALADLTAHVLGQLWPEATCVVTETLGEALSAMQAQPPALCLVDLLVPDSQGLATLEAVLRSLHPVVPVIVMSAYLNRLESFRALEMGATAVIRKAEGQVLSRLKETALEAWALTCGHQRREQAWDAQTVPLAADR